MASLSSSIDKSIFGNGYSTDGEKSNSFLFTSDNVHFSPKAGIGGAVPVRDYDGPWPLFGEVKDSWEAHHLEQMDGIEAGPSEIITTSLNRAPRMMCRSTGKCRACKKKEVSGALMGELYYRTISSVSFRYLLVSRKVDLIASLMVTQLLSNVGQ